MTLHTSLVQRLLKPPVSELDGKITQVFGGGMMGITKEGWNVIQQIFDLDYMGAAEYEFGEFPKTMRELAEETGEYSIWDFTISPKNIKPGWWRDSIITRTRRAQIDAAKKEGKKPPRFNQKKLEASIPLKPVKEVKVWVFGKIAQKAEIEDLILRVGREEEWVKAGARFELDPDPTYKRSREVCGWLDLRNRLFWFTNEEMCKKTAKLFEPDEVPEPKNEEQRV